MLPVIPVAAMPARQIMLMKTPYVATPVFSAVMPAFRTLMSAVIGQTRRGLYEQNADQEEGETVMRFHKPI